MTVRSEEEAKKSVCCKPSGKTIADNGLCIGSACMAWRWRAKSVLVEVEGGDSVWQYHGEGRGYCGFANAPTELTHLNGEPITGGNR